MNNKKSVIAGVVAGLILLIFYFVLLSLLNSFSHAVSEFGRLWYWVLLLAGGFGLQVGLYSFIKDAIRQKQIKGATGAVAASGALSAGSMLACCLHHLTDVLPLLGLAAATVFLLKYQTFFILIGVLSNIIGIAIMLEIVQNNDIGGNLIKKFLIGDESRRSRVSVDENGVLIVDMAKIKKVIIALSLAAALITFLLIAKNKARDTTPSDVVKNLPVITNEQDGISFEVKPLDFDFAKPLKFEIKITTHTGSLDFDLTRISTLEDSEGNQYRPLDWQGSPPGGHHRSGTLIFEQIKKATKSIKLVIQNMASPRIFEWNLEQD